MHDIKLIRENPEAFDAGMARRGVEPQSAAILALDSERRNAESLHQTQLAERNRIAKEIGMAKAAKDETRFAELMELRNAIGDAAGETGQQFGDQLRSLLAALPNLPDADVPEGADEAGNAEVSKWGKPRQFNFAPMDHADLGPALGLDFETGALISGARFTFLRGQMARLQRALGQFMLDQQTIEHGYIECAPPLLVRDEAAFGTGQLPKFEDDLFDTDISLGPVAYIDFKMKALELAIGAGQFEEMADITDRTVWDALPNPPTRRWLVPTAEVSLTNSVREQILAETQLPIRMTALTPCFRSEAGAAGKDTRGYIRQHQFEKVELVSITTPDFVSEWKDSKTGKVEIISEHERMTRCAESILQALDLPYQKVLLCAGDMGFTARKTYDLEVWLPGQNAYREISSCSNCGDFQARRMDTRYKPEGQSKGPWPFVHTLNGSGLAVGRTLVAVLENYQQEDGSVTVPPALLPYMGGITALVPA